MAWHTNLPEVTIRAGFGTDPNVDTDPATWTDVTDYVRSWSTSRGRSSDQERMGSGTAQITFDNRDRRFDPTHSTGPYFASLRPRVPVSIRCVWQSTTYNIFRGFIAGWRSDPDTAYGEYTSVEAFGRLGLLAAANLPADRHRGALIDRGFTRYYPLGSTSKRHRNVTVPASDTSTDGRTTQNVAVGVPPTPLVAASAFNSKSDRIYFPATSVRTVSLWVKTTSAGALVPLLQGPNSFIGLGFDGTVIADRVGGNSSTSFLKVNDGKWHHVCCVADSTLDLMVIAIDGSIDNVLINAGGDPSTTFDDLSSIAGGYDFAGGTLVTPFVGSLAAVALSPIEENLVTSTAAMDIYQSGLDVIEDAGERVDAVCATMGLPAPVATGPYSARLGSAPFGSRPVAEYLAEVEDTEMAPIVEGADGVLTVLGRYWFQDSAYSLTSVFTFSDDGGAGSVPYSGGGFVLDGDLAVNAASVTSTSSGTTAEASDLTSQGLYGPRGVSIRTQAADASDAQGVADGWITRWATPTVRVTEWAVTPRTQTSPQWAGVLGIELAERVTLERTPASTGVQTVVSLLVDSIAHDVDMVSGRWRINFGGSPAPLVAGTSQPWWVLGTSALGTTAEPQTRLGY